MLPAAFFWTLAQPYIEAYQQVLEPPPAPPWWQPWQRWRPGRRQQRPQLELAEGAVVDAVYTG